MRICQVVKGSLGRKVLSLKTTPGRQMKHVQGVSMSASGERIIDGLFARVQHAPAELTLTADERAVVDTMLEDRPPVEDYKGVLQMSGDDEKPIICSACTKVHPTRATVKPRAGGLVCVSDCGILTEGRRKRAADGSEPPPPSKQRKQLSTANEVHPSSAPASAVERTALVPVGTAEPPAAAMPAPVPQSMSSSEPPPLLVQGVMTEPPVTVPPATGQHTTSDEVKDALFARYGRIEPVASLSFASLELPPIDAANAGQFQPPRLDVHRSAAARGPGSEPALWFKQVPPRPSSIHAPPPIGCSRLAPLPPRPQMTGREWDADVASFKAAVQDYRKRRFRSNVPTPLLEPMQIVPATAPRTIPPPTPLPSPPPPVAMPDDAEAITPTVPPRLAASLLAAPARPTMPPTLVGQQPLGAHPPAPMSLRPTPPFVRAAPPPPAPLATAPPSFEAPKVAAPPHVTLPAPPALVSLPPPRVALQVPLAPPPTCQQTAQHAPQTVATALAPLPPPAPLAPPPVAALPVRQQAAQHALQSVAAVPVPLPPPAPLARQPVAALPVQQQTALRVPLAAPATVPAPLASPDLSSRPAASAATSNACKRTVPISDVNPYLMRDQSQLVARLNDVRRHDWANTKGGADQRSNAGRYARWKGASC